MEIDVRDAAAELERLLDRVSGGGEVVITRDGVPAVRLERVPRPLGFVHGTVPDAFAEPLPEAELEQWN